MIFNADVPRVLAVVVSLVLVSYRVSTLVNLWRGRQAQGCTGSPVWSRGPELTGWSVKCDNHITGVPWPVWLWGSLGVKLSIHLDVQCEKGVYFWKHWASTSVEAAGLVWPMTSGSWGAGKCLGKPPWMLAWDSSVRKNELLSLRMSTQPPASWFAAFWLHLGPVIMGLREMTWSLAGLWVAGPPQAQWQPAWQKPSSGDRPCSPEPPPMPVFLLFPSAPRVSALAPGSAIRRLSVHTFLELCLIPWCLMSWKENIPIRQSTQLSIYYSCNSLVWCAPMFLL